MLLDLSGSHTSRKSTRRWIACPTSALDVSTLNVSILHQQLHMGKACTSMTARASFVCSDCKEVGSTRVGLTMTAPSEQRNSGDLSVVAPDVRPCRF